MAACREQVWERLLGFVEARMRTHGIPGVALGVVTSGEVRTAGLGVTHVDHPLPVTAETLFQIGSITKTFTGTLLLRLIEEGKVDLDAPIRSYLPGFAVADPEASERATARHLLTHTAGWVGDFFEDTGSGADALAAYVARMRELEQLAPVGSVWSYNNAGFVVAGLILETVTGHPYAKHLRETLLEPLGLRSCRFDAGEVMLERFAVGHRVTADGAEVARPWPLPAYVQPAGGIVCDICDLMAYARFHLGDGEAEGGARLLSSETIEAMHTPRVTVWGQEGWGLPFAVDEGPGVRVTSHGGGTVGQTSLLSLVRERGFALGVMTNADRGAALARETVRYALKEYLGVSLEEPTPLPSNEAELVPLVGRYVRPMAEVELGLLGARLVGQLTYQQGFPTRDDPAPPPPPPMTLAPCAEDRLLVLDGPMRGTTAEVVRRADGTIGWLRLGGRIHPRRS